MELLLQRKDDRIRVQFVTDNPYTEAFLENVKNGKLEKLEKSKVIDFHTIELYKSDELFNPIFVEGFSTMVQYLIEQAGLDFKLGENPLLLGATTMFCISRFPNLVGFFQGYNDTTSITNINSLVDVDIRRLDMFIKYITTPMEEVIDEDAIVEDKEQLQVEVLENKESSEGISLEVEENKEITLSDTNEIGIDLSVSEDNDISQMEDLEV